MKNLKQFVGVLCVFFSVTAFACDESTLPTPSFDSAHSQLVDIGFIVVEGGKRRYQFAAVEVLTTKELVGIYAAVKTQNDEALQFWLKVAGSAQGNAEQARCFVRQVMLKDKSQLLVDLAFLSKLIAKQPERQILIDALTAIAKQMDGDTVHDYLQQERAVYYTVGGQGTGINLANARINRKRVQHLPNSVMKIMAEHLRRDESAHRTTIYQVENMGYTLD